MRWFFIKVLVVDDEKLIRDVIHEYLALDKIDVEEAENGLEAVEKCKNTSYDVVIMDIMMPKMDGFQAVKEIKEFATVPFIMLSARGEEYDKLLGFDLGIDDYVTKPFSPKELVARVKAVSKRNTTEEVSKYIFEGLVIDDVAHEVKINDKLVFLTPKEYDLLKFLVQNKNIALSREQLLQKIWGYDFYGDDRTVDTHIKTLRNQLGPYRDYIQTIRKVGYKFEFKEKVQS